MPPKTKPNPFTKATTLKDIKIGAYFFRENQPVHLKNKTTKKTIIGKEKNKTIIEDMETLIFIGIGGGTGSGITRVDKYNKWYSLSNKQVENFSFTNLI